MTQHQAAESREQEFLLRVVGSHHASSAEWAAMASGVDWTRFTRLAGRQLIPYASHRLSELSLHGIVPQDLRLAWDRMIRAETMIWLEQQATLRDIVNALTARGIGVIALKGVALSHLVYPRPALRPMLDLDLWIAPQQVTEAMATLRAIGFEVPPRHDVGVSARDEPELQTHRTLRRPDSRITVELHAPPGSLARVGEARLRQAWDRAVTASCSGFELRVLHPQDLLLHLGVHAVKHRFGIGLRPLVDLSLVLRRWNTSWPWAEMVDDYRRTASHVGMSLCFQLARDLLAAPVPQHVLDELPTPSHNDEMKALARRAALEAVDGRLPSLALYLSESRSRFDWLRRVAFRLTLYYWPRRARGRTLRRALLEAARRIRFDLSEKIPEYVRLWHEGLLSGRSLHHRATLAKVRARLGDLLANSDGSADAR